MAVRAHLDQLDAVSRLSPVVIRILGDNPSKFTLQGTNTYLIGNGSERILLDTGEGKPAWKERLAKVLEAEKATIDKILLSHWHPDHVGGVEDVKSLVRARGRDAVELSIYKCRPRHGEEDIQDGQIIETTGARLRALHSPGHTKDHMAFVLEGEDAMFTADNVLGHGTAVFEDLATYLESLQKMKVFKGRAYPGHGPVLADGVAKIEEYIQHRKAREDQILTAMQACDRTGRPQSWQVVDIVQEVYRDIPESLHQAAAGGVVQILQKLKSEDKVVPVEGDGWRLQTKANISL